MTEGTAAYVTPSVLRWARESIGYSAQEAASKLKLYTWELEAAESGDDLLTLRQAEKAADLYERPLATLFLPTPPREESQETQFRRLPGAPPPPWPPELNRLIRRVRDRQAAAAEIYDLLEEPPPWETTARAFAGVRWSELATRVRERLGISVEVQRDWKDPQGYTGLRSWVDAVEDQGVMVMQGGAPVEVFRGFASLHPSAPAIVLNTKDDPRARTFSVIHEFGHLILEAAGGPTGPETEPWCNEFAGEVLMPAEALEATFAEATGDYEERTQYVALTFGVTPLAAAVRISRTGLLPRALADALIEQIKSRPPRERSGGGNYYRNKVTWLGPAFIRLVLEAAETQAVTLSNAAGLLEAKVNQFQRLRATLESRGEFG